MRNLAWICCCYLWEGLPALLAFPIDTAGTLSTSIDSWSSHWENHWPRYALGTLGFVVIAFTLAGCLCCRRQRRPKGFQDDAGNGKEFKDGSTAGTETTIERPPSSSLELEVPRSLGPEQSKVQFEALPVERLINDSRISSGPKPPSPSLFTDEDRETVDDKNLFREQPCREWFDADSCHVPRERLKYLREIGRGWFGKVVEGTADTSFEIEGSAGEHRQKNRGVVVRILTEEASTREKAWFLGEATPYLKLRHPNILGLLGCCLETDPYLLLFESCPAGDLKGFLRSNRDKVTSDVLRKENFPTRVALDIAHALEHMHQNNFAHTDLSARNCLVAPDLTAKLGDYGTGVEKYPGDYYVVGDRALPIRWSAPESLECTETTIETRAITPRANLWSYGVLLWEICTWGERPYDELGDEQVIQMIFSLKKNSPEIHGDSRTFGKFDPQTDENFVAAVRATWKFLPTQRASLEEARKILQGERIQDFERRWENLRPNGTSASLQDLRGSVESAELFGNCTEILGQDDTATSSGTTALQAKFRLGPDEPVATGASLPVARNSCNQESGSETEEESWRGRVERGAYTEKVKQKSKSVADLMVLVHIDSDSDVDVSLGPQSTDKTKKRIPASGSDGDLRCAVLAEEFDEAIRKLRETPGKSYDPKVLTLTQQDETPILRLSFATDEKSPVQQTTQNKNPVSNYEGNVKEFCSGEAEKSMKSMSVTNEGPIFRLVSKGDPDLALLRYEPEVSTKNVSVNSDTVNVELWDDALGRVLSKKNRLYDADNLFLEHNADDTAKKRTKRSSRSASAPNTPTSHGNSFRRERIIKDFTTDSSTSAPETPRRSSPQKSTFSSGILDEDSSATVEELQKGSAPDTPQSRGNYSVANLDEDSSTGEELEAGDRAALERSSREVEEEEDRKHLSTPDDERSSDSGFRDKESCEEEESPVPCTEGTSAGPVNSLTASAEEEQMRILFELDTILDAEYYGSFHKETDSETEVLALSPSNIELRFSGERGDVGVPTKNRSISESLESSGTTVTTEIMETVRANSCEPDFLESHSARDEELRKLGEFLKNEGNCEKSGEDFEKNFHEIFDATEADFLGDSMSEEGSIKTDRKDGSSESSAELRKLNVDQDTEVTEAKEKLETSTDDSMESSADLKSSERKTSSGSSELKLVYSSEVLRSLDVELSDSTSESIPKEENFSASPIKVADFPTESASKSHEIIKNSSNSSDLTTCLSSEKVERKLIDLSCELDLACADEKTGSLGKGVENRDDCRESGELKDIANFLSGEDDGKTKKWKTFQDLSNESLLKTSEDSENKLLERPEALSSTKTLACPTAVIIATSLEEGENIENSCGSDLSLTSEQKNHSSDSANSTSQSSVTTAQRLEVSEKENENLSGSSVKIEKQSEDSLSPEVEDSSSDSPMKSDLRLQDSLRIPDSVELLSPSETDQQNSTSSSPLKTDRLQISDVSLEVRGGDSLHSDVEQWSSRETMNENDNENENDDEDSSTMSLRSDNSYVSFGLDEEFVAAIRNELREKLPRAQMPVVETLDPRENENEPSINKDGETNKSWDDDDTDETDENTDRGSGGVDISIRYNIYGTPLSPILEERESGTSESLISKDDSRDDSIASRVSALSEDVLVVDTRTNQAMILEGTMTGNSEAGCTMQDDDRDTSHGDFSDEENLEYPRNNLTRSMESKRIVMGTGGAPLPSPEEETKWQQQFPLPLQMQDDLMSTSFGTDRDWDSQDEDEGDEDPEDDEEDEEENSSSSGEFVWKRYDEAHRDLENVATRSPPNKPKSQPEVDLDEEDEGDEDDEEEDEEEEFTPSAWDATLAPHRSALRSPEKNLKSTDQKKSVWFKKQRYHCVYEYPKETPVADGQGQSVTTWEPTSYADWEEMMDEPRHDVYPMEYDESSRAGDEEFYVSSSNRPFQFQSGEGKYVSQFFPGASSTLLQQEPEGEDCPDSASIPVLGPGGPPGEIDRSEVPAVPLQQGNANGSSRSSEPIENLQAAQQTQLGELRHTRDRLKLNLLSTSGAAKSEDDVTVEEHTEKSSVNETSSNQKEQKSDTPTKETKKSPEREAVEIKNEESIESSPEKTGKFDEPTEECESTAINESKTTLDSPKKDEKIVEDDEANSRSHGDQKDSSKSHDNSLRVNDSTSGQIVDIPKLNAPESDEESMEVKKETRRNSVEESRSFIPDKSESTGVDETAALVVAQSSQS